MLISRLKLEQSHLSPKTQDGYIECLDTTNKHLTSPAYVRINTTNDLAVLFAEETAKLVFLAETGGSCMFKTIWKLVKILFVALIIFGIVSMVVSLIVTFSLSAKMATEMSAQLNTGQTSVHQTYLSEINTLDQRNIAPGRSV